MRTEDRVLDVDLPSHDFLNSRDRTEKHILEEDEYALLPPITTSATTDLLELGDSSDANDEQQHPRLNILILYADDWRHDTLGSASNNLVYTPFFDRLAKEGIRFIQNCVTTSICWISRVTYYSGQWYSRHGTFTIGSIPERGEHLYAQYWNETFPGMLKSHGYYTGHVGKWHSSAPCRRGEEFDFVESYYGWHWMERDGKDIHVTKANEEDAIKFLRTRPDKDQPFMLSVNFFAPHSDDEEPEQYFPQNSSMSLYKNITIPMAPSATEEAWKKMPNFFTEKNEGRIRYHWRFNTTEKYQRMMKNYFRLVSEVDASSQAIVEELERQGVLNSTMVIFTTDNGMFLAEHGLAAKFFPHEESIRVPLIIRDPRMRKELVGTENDEFTLSVDLASTILGAAGIKQPARMQGRDISTLYRYTDADNAGAEPWRKEFFYEMPPLKLGENNVPSCQALVRKDFKLMWWPFYQQYQLFDLKNDPYEMNDLLAGVSMKNISALEYSDFEYLDVTVKMLRHMRRLHKSVL
eukprot:CAMPEP_0116008258 /NCGR_PEP_ID=MMETSP0321-20121206/2762_1 /TAXON_ID=163516 /ORGANISM="Leptocylindrus danicus var. danicus, Strain B650" /LENGTH=520 /DNA_ID=CAMNT_0003477059 /DNA_START=215 /DNA_END=1777 /DNA_ORIENTATION=+